MTRLAIIILGLLISTSCKKDKALSKDSVWTVPKDEIKDGGPGKDGIPAVDNAKFVSVSEATHIEENELVVVIKRGSEIKVYPHSILDRHEIVNDAVNGVPLSVIYCPLTGTATSWSRLINGSETTYGVSGLLFNSNVIPYDRATESNWSQLRLDCINGALIGAPVTSFHVIETTWSTIKDAYPNLLAMSEDTGYDRNYDVYPYGDYKTNHNNIIFPVSNEDSRNNSKDRMLAIITNGKLKAYEISNFESDIEVFQESYEGESLVIFGSQFQNIASAYKRTLAGDLLDFTTLPNEFPDIMQDQDGNKWNIFGECTEGARLGQWLDAPESITGYWFSFAAFYPDLVIGK